MEFSSEQRRTLRYLREVLLEAGLDRMPAVPRPGQAAIDPAALPEPARTIARLFCCAGSVESPRLEPAGLFLALEEFGLLERDGDRVSAGPFRLVNHMGVFLFCENVSPTARLYYGEDSLALSQLLYPAEGRVLDLCTGPGAQALTCARTASWVTAVDKEPFAERMFWLNATLNGLEDKVEFFRGDLLEPVKGRRFDLISANPPFMPVPAGVRLPLFAGGGADGLEVVRRLLAALPDVLEPHGKCHIVGALMGNENGPDTSAFEELADAVKLGITVDCIDSEDIGAAVLASCGGTAMTVPGDEDPVEAFRRHFASAGATRLYYYLLTAIETPRPAVCVIHDGIERVRVGPA